MSRDQAESKGADMTASLVLKEMATFHLEELTATALPKDVLALPPAALAGAEADLSVCALSSDHSLLAISYGHRLFVCECPKGSKRKTSRHKAQRGSHDTSRELFYEGREQGDNITCMHWLVITEQDTDRPLGFDSRCLVVGFQSGYLRCLSKKGDVLLSPFLHDAAAIRIRVGTAAHSRLSLISRPYAHFDLMAVFEGAVICWVEGESLVTSVLGKLQALADGAFASADNFEWKYQKWRSSSQANILDVVFSKHMLPLTLEQEFMAPGGYLKPSVHLVAVGTDPMISYYNPKNAKTHSLTGIALSKTFKLATTIATKAASTIFSLANSWLGSQQAPVAPDTPDTKPKPVNTIEAKAMPQTRCLKDKPRTIHFISSDPSQTYAVLCDNLGRVMLIQLRHFVVVRMWKGYREAQCAWLKCPQKMGLYLAIYVRKYGVLELWRINGDRVGVANIGTDCKLLQGYTSDSSGPSRALSRTPVGTVLDSCVCKAFVVRIDGTLQEVTINTSALRRAGRTSTSQTAGTPSQRKLQKDHNTVTDLLQKMKSYMSQHRCQGYECEKPSEAHAQGLLNTLQKVFSRNFVTGTDQLSMLQRFLFGEDGFLPVQFKAFVSRTQPSVKATPTPSSQTRTLCPMFCATLLQCLQVAIATVVEDVEGDELSIQNASAKSTKARDFQQFQRQLQALQLHVDTLWHLLCAHGYLHCKDLGAHEATGEEGAPVPISMNLHSFFSLFCINKTSTSLVASMSSTRKNKLCDLFFSFRDSDRDLQRFRQALQSLHRATLSPRTIMSLFIRWFSHLSIDHIHKECDVQGHLFGVVSTLQSVPGASTHRFFDSAIQFTETTFLHQHAIGLMRVCSRVQAYSDHTSRSGQDDLDEELDAGEDVVPWARDIIDRLGTLQLIHSYLPRVDRTRITNACLAGAYPLGRLVAMQALYAHAEKKQAQKAELPPWMDVAVTIEEISVSLQDRLLADDSGDSDAEASGDDEQHPGSPGIRKKRPAAEFVNQENVQALARLLNPTFGFTGRQKYDQPLILFYCAYELFQRYKKTPQHALLLASTQYLEHATPAAYTGGLALDIWSIVSAPLEAVLGTWNGATETDGGVVLRKAMHTDWNLDYASAHVLCQVAERVLGFLDRCHGAMQQTPQKPEANTTPMALQSQVANEQSALFEKVVSRCSRPLSDSTLRHRQVITLLSLTIDHSLRVGGVKSAQTISKAKHNAAGLTQLPFAKLFPAYKHVDPLVLPEEKSAPTTSTEAKAKSVVTDSVSEPQHSSPVDTRPDMALCLQFLLGALVNTEKDIAGRLEGAADVLEVDVDELRREAVLLLLQRGDISAAAEVLTRTDKKLAIAAPMLTICTQQVSGFLKALARTSKPLYDYVTSSVSADLWHWFHDELNTGKAWTPPALKYRCKTTRRQGDVDSILSLQVKVQAILSHGPGTSSEEKLADEDAVGATDAAFVAKLIRLTKQIRSGLHSFQPA